MYSIQIINELRQLGEYTCTFVVVNDFSVYPEVRIDKNFSDTVTQEEIEAEKVKTLQDFQSPLANAESVNKEEFLSNILQ
jgi:hypothetical protein